LRLLAVALLLLVGGATIARVGAKRLR
jgi:hypothetical protein